MQVVESFPYLHASEISLLNRICRLGSYYQRFEAFIAQQSCPSVTLLRAEKEEGGSCGGLYLRALANGLNTVLQDYRQALLGVEKKALADAHLPITQVEHELEEVGQGTLPIACDGRWWRLTAVPMMNKEIS